MKKLTKRILIAIFLLFNFASLFGAILGSVNISSSTALCDGYIIPPVNLKSPFQLIITNGEYNCFNPATGESFSANLLRRNYIALASACWIFLFLCFSMVTCFSLRKIGKALARN